VSCGSAHFGVLVAQLFALPRPLVGGVGVGFICFAVVQHCPIEILRSHKIGVSYVAPIFVVSVAGALCACVKPSKGYRRIVAFAGSEMCVEKSAPKQYVGG